MTSFSFYHVQFCRVASKLRSAPFMARGYHRGFMGGRMMRFFRIFLGLTAMMLFCCCDKKTELPITIAINDDIVSLDPSGTKDTLSETVARCVFSTLYMFDEKMNLVPLLAENDMRLSELQWKFTLRKNVKFHDGSPLSSSDVKFSLERAMTVPRAEKNLLVIDKIDIPDEYSVIITTSEPISNLPSLFVRVSTSVMSEKALKNPLYDFNRPVGSGPFPVVGRTLGKSINLERFDAYFLPTAKASYINFVVEPSEQNRTAGLLNKNFDVVYRVSPNDCDYLKLSDGIRVYETKSTKMEIMMFNTGVPPLNDIRVRKAISCAINKQNLVDNVISGYGVSLESVIPPPVLGAIEFDGFYYDTDAARELLRQAGLANGFDLSVITFDEVRKKMMEYIKLDLAKVGIRLNYEFMDLNSYLNYIYDNKHMSTIMSWTSNPDPDSTLAQMFSKYGAPSLNHSKFTNERVEQLIIEGKKESDSVKRRLMYEEANNIIAASYYALPLYQPSMLVAASNEIDGIRMNAQGMFGYEDLCWIKK